MPGQLTLVVGDGCQTKGFEYLNRPGQGDRAEHVGRAGLLAVGEVGPRDHAIGRDGADGAAADGAGLGGRIEGLARADEDARAERARTSCGR